MADNTNQSPPAPATENKPQGSPTPHSASGTTSTDGGAKVAPPNSPVPRDGLSAPATRDAANEVRSGKPIQRAGVITNPAPVVDPDAPVREEPVSSVPQSTIDEMAAGKKALERNRPVATKMEEARAAKEAGVSTSPETNPVDATHTLQQQGKV